MSQLTLTPMKSGGADISSDRLYRWRLWRSWGDLRHRCAFVMLNPSTADATVDDPTIRRCITFAKDWGYDGIEVVNLFARRATNPAELRRIDYPIGESNNEAIERAALSCDRIICAWGNHGALLRRGIRVLKLLRGVTRRQEIMALTVTKEGHPGHPLYLRRDTDPFVWDGGRNH